MTKVTNNQTNSGQCACPTCPSYNVCSKEKHVGLFCAIPLEQRVCTYNENGCVCGDCPIYKNNKLETGYYCINGSADETE